MSSRHPRYGQIDCEICGQSITINGMGRASHMDAHVRRHEARITNLDTNLLLLRAGIDPLPNRYEKIDRPIGSAIGSEEQPDADRRHELPD